MEDVRWLGFDWEDRLFYASDYFEQIYEWAIQLIQAGKAYVCDLTADEVRETPRHAHPSRARTAPIATARSKRTWTCSSGCAHGEFPDGSRTLRAKIDMASPNLNLRDPVMYRILHATHHRTGDKWCIYPTYDFTHGQSDSIERITHSICTLEFENHRPLYDWYIQELGIYAPQQIEFARLNLTYTVMSKRRLLELVKEGFVNGWDDPRMPTICGLRRRGYTPEAIRNFCARIGVAKFDSVIDIALLGALPARGPEQAGAAGDGRAAAAEGGDRQLSRRARSSRWRRSTIPKTRAWARGKSPSRASCTSSRTISARTRRRSTIAWPRARKCGSATPTWSRCTSVVKDPTDRRGGRGALHLRPGHPRRQHARRPQGEGHDPLGFGGPRRAGRSPALRPPVHQARPRRRARRAGLQGRTSTRTRWKW